MSTIQQVSTSSDADAIITLFVLDTTVIGGTAVFRFTRSSKETSSLMFGGQEYSGIPVEATGFEWDGRGAFPSPVLRVANIAGLVSAAVIEYNDLIGARLTRIRTFEQFLDDGDNPDPTAMYPLEIYTVEQKLKQNNVFIEWKLASALDQANRQIPGRLCIRDRCTHTYRRWDTDTETFTYDGVSCPYTAASAYDANGDETADSTDNCGRRLIDCKLRFGQNNELPTRAMFGIARTR